MPCQFGCKRFWLVRLVFVMCIDSMHVPIHSCFAAGSSGSLSMTSRLWSCNSLVEAVPLLDRNSTSMADADAKHDLKARIEVLCLS